MASLRNLEIYREKQLVFKLSRERVDSNSRTACHPGNRNLNRPALQHSPSVTIFKKVFALRQVYSKRHNNNNDCAAIMCIKYFILTSRLLISTIVDVPHANLQSCILYIYSTNKGTEYFKHGIYSPSFPFKNAVCFIILTYLIPVLFTFYIQDVLKLKK